MESKYTNIPSNRKLQKILSVFLTLVMLPTICRVIYGTHIKLSYCLGDHCTPMN